MDSFKTTLYLFLATKFIEVVFDKALKRKLSKLVVHLSYCADVRNYGAILGWSRLICANPYIALGRRPKVPCGKVGLV